MAYIIVENCITHYFVPQLFQWINRLLAALASNSKSRLIRWLHRFCRFFRSIPPLVLLIFVCSGLPFAGLRLSPFTAVVIAFSQ